MGNSSSSGRGHHDETVDYGALVPQGVYTGPRDWNQAIVSQLIVARRLAPFYRPLEEYEESWDEDQILAARKELPDPDNADSVTRIEATNPSNGHRTKRPASLKEPSKPEAQVYRGAVECPICFLYYPPNINHSRCCDQAICTECFVQIKRAEPTATHLISEPAACPYCVQDNFGVVYNPPPWRAGLGSEGSSGLWADPQRSSEPTAPPTHKRRQKSFSADSPEVVTTDQIRPDWEAKLEAVRAAVARRANRRIIMRQVGDRLIPVGVTSGRVHALTPEEAAAAGADGSGRRSRRRQQQGGGAFEQYVGIGGQDLEEMMLMEAMRLSLLDHEEHQRKEAEEKKKQEAAAAAAAAAGGGNPPEAEAATSPSESPALGPGPSTLEARTSAPSSSNLLSSRSSIGHSSSGPSSRTHDRVDSQESLSPGRKPWSISRSRTPSPPPLPNPAGNIPTSEENQAAWRSMSTATPTYSTLSAALTSTSTAAAFLGTPPSGPTRPITPPRASTATPALIPTITIANDSAAEARVIPSVDDTTISHPSTSSAFTPSEPMLNPFSDPFRDPDPPATNSTGATISTPSTSSESGESGTGIGVGSLGYRLPANPNPPPVNERSDLDMAKVGEAPASYLQEVSSL